jgi:hypothetical protein
MNPIFKKLNFKDQDQVHIVNAPESFQKDMNEMADLTTLKTSLSGVKKISFFLGFVTQQKQVDDLTAKVIPLLEDDGVFWFAYPKGTSKKYTCEFNRDNGWGKLGGYDFEPVRMVAIDEDWSALRFRKAEHIKTMSRSKALSETGKKKIAARKKAR